MRDAGVGAHGAGMQPCPRGAVHRVCGGYVARLRSERAGRDVARRGRGVVHARGSRQGVEYVLGVCGTIDRAVCPSCPRNAGLAMINGRCAPARTAHTQRGDQPRGRGGAEHRRGGGRGAGLRRPGHRGVLRDCRRVRLLVCARLAGTTRPCYDYDLTDQRGVCRRSLRRAPPCTWVAMPATGSFSGRTMRRAPCAASRARRVRWRTLRRARSSTCRLCVPWRTCRTCVCFCCELICHVLYLDTPRAIARLHVMPQPKCSRQGVRRARAGCCRVPRPPHAMQGRRECQRMHQRDRAAGAGERGAHACGLAGVAGVPGRGRLGRRARAVCVRAECCEAECPDSDRGRAGRPACGGVADRACVPTRPAGLSCPLSPPVSIACLNVSVFRC